MYPLQSDDPRAITDYLLTSFEEHKMITGQCLQELESKLVHIMAELEELKEITRKRADIASDSKGKRTRRRIPKEVSVS